MIRPLRAHDAEPATALIHAAFAAIEPPLDPPPGALAETPASIRPQTGAVWDEQALLGCILWREHNGGLYIGRLAVHPAHRRRGIAASLVAAAEHEARHRQLPRLLAGVRLPLLGNRRLFATCGFTETTLQTHPGYPAPTSIDLVKSLSSL